MNFCVYACVDVLQAYVCAYVCPPVRKHVCAYLSKAQLDSPLLKGLGELLKLLQVTGLLQAGCVHALWCTLGVGQGLDWSSCYRASRGRGLQHIAYSTVKKRKHSIR